MTLGKGKPQFDDVTIQKALGDLMFVKPGQGDLVPSMAAKHCCHIYEKLDDAGRGRFIKILVNDFGTIHQDATEAAQKYLSAEDGARGRLSLVLRHTLVPLHHRFFDGVNQLPSGMRFLVDMRADALRLAKETGDSDFALFSESLLIKLQANHLAVTRYYARASDAL
ncbi:hypothetical protein L0F63_005185 [Massospora cicadina]|nr:hypothetical protein L0F63_005185 [Massospora cicadina]